MSNLTTGTMRSGNNLTIHNNSSADTGSQSSHDQVFRSLTTAFPHFSQCCYVRIISNFYRNSSQKIFQFISQHRISPMKIYCHCDLSFSDYRSRHSYTYTANLFFCNLFLVHFIEDCFCDIRKDCFTIILCTCHNLPFLTKFSACLKQTTFYCSSSNIYSKAI